ncbi:exosortase H-associated membrane protein [Usitatibacter palustris]|uniref:Uncharacterized protein n=1 Tax=Usitatibacter palustris TaxID=2732487 RepID=A0A6M4H5P6_9PROT|nr:exosortase H-associated membrane protein [Usitatibacter palustris]QJR14946.1 hypothetical protein DSM104440_01761 [Usitatibacter palustris]
MFASRGEILALLGKTLLLLPLALVAWFFAAPLLNSVAAHVAKPVISLASGAKMAGPVMQGHLARYELTLHPPYERRELQPAMTELEVNASTFSFGIALFVALSLASAMSRRAGPMAIGAIVLLIAPAWGVTFDILRQLSAVHELAPYLALSSFGREGIALGYQVGSLLLPTLLPIALWLGLNQRRMLMPMKAPETASGGSLADAVPPREKS